MKRYAVLLLSLFALLAWAEEREEFHQTYALAATGHVSLHNVNGPVRITAWDQNQVKVDAVKHARTQQGLRNAEIVVDSQPDSIVIKTKYPEHNDHDGASVDYTLMVPRRAVLENISTVNGSVEVEGVGGGLKASSVNGNVVTRGVDGDADLSTVNGRVEAEFDKLTGKSLKLHTVNGAISLALPSGAGAKLSVHSVHGGINSDFDLPVRNVGFGPGSSLESTFGGGGTDIQLDTVNGGITLKKR